MYVLIRHLSSHIVSDREVQNIRNLEPTEGLVGLRLADANLFRTNLSSFILLLDVVALQGSIDIIYSYFLFPLPSQPPQLYSSMSFQLVFLMRIVLKPSFNLTLGSKKEP